MNAKNKLKVRKIVCAAIFFILIIVAFVMMFAQPSRAKMVDENGYIIDYNATYNKTEAEVEVTLNKPVDSGSITVSFYDENGDLLSTRSEDYESDSLEGPQRTVTFKFIVLGRVDMYHIEEYYFVNEDSATQRGDDGTMLFLFTITIGLAFLTDTLLCNLKCYLYEGKTICVYAGYYHKYVEVDGKKMDEYNTLGSLFAPVRLSCTLDDGTNLDATVSAFKRVTLKVNNQLYTKEKND